jgi:hypothetical protein
MEAKPHVVFRCPRFDRTFSEEGGDSEPPPGRDLAQAWGAALEEAGLTVVGLQDKPSDPRNDRWEHSYWFFYVTHDRTEYFVQVECVWDEDDRRGYWIVSLTKKVGCLRSIIVSPRSAVALPNDLQRLIEQAIERIAEPQEMIWVTDEQADASWR